MCAAVCCPPRSNGSIEAILALIALFAVTCCSRALCNGWNDLPHTCEYLRVFRRIFLPHRAQDVINNSACLHGGRVGVSTDVSANVSADVLSIFNSATNKKERC